MDVVFGTVAPVFALIALGYLMVRAGVLGLAGADGLMVYVFYAATPALLFASVARGSLAAGAQFWIAATFLAASVMFFLASVALARAAFGSGLAAGAVLAMNTTFGNTVILGIPLILKAFGPPAEGPLLAIIGLQSVLIIPLATVLIELGMAGRGPLGATLRRTFLSLVRHPVIASLAIGYAWAALALPVPEPAERVLAMLAVSAGPAALVALGASLAGFRVERDVARALAASALKLAAFPLVVWAAAHGAGVPGFETKVMVTAAALPTGANAFILAARYRLDEPASAATVVISTAISFVTLSLVLALFPG